MLFNVDFAGANASLVGIIIFNSGSNSSSSSGGSNRDSDSSSSCRNGKILRGKYNPGVANTNWGSRLGPGLVNTI